MTEELKPLPCPWCGTAPREKPNGLTACSNPHCGVFSINMTLEQWNTRSPAWRDIESAPRDGDDPECLAWVDGIVEKVYWDGHGFVLDNEAWRDGPTQYVEPAHWMPLPLPPEER